MTTSSTFTTPTVSSGNFLQISLFTFLWFFLHVLSHHFSQFLAPKTYATIEAKKKPFWNIRVVSTIHATLVSLYSLSLLNDPALNADMLFGYSEGANFLACIAVGYFLYDLLCCVYYFSEFGMGFTLHGLACFLVYFFSLRPFLQAFAPVFLLFELSTPFLNINWFLDKFGKTGSMVQFVNGLFLVGTFIGSRIIYGFYQSYIFWDMFLTRKDEIPPFLFWYYGIANIFLNGLNAFWLLQMFDALKKRFKGPKASAKKN